MTQEAPLVPDERSWIEDLTKEIIERTGLDGTAAIADEVLPIVRRRARAGDDLAMRAREHLEREGLMKLAWSVLKSDKTRVKTRRSDQIVTMPSRVGIKAVDESTGEVLRWFQQTLWWELPWTRLLEAVRNLESQRNTLDRDIEAFREILGLREKYPETKTAMEACELEGIDPRSFSLAA